MKTIVTKASIVPKKFQGRYVPHFDIAGTLIPASDNTSRYSLFFISHIPLSNEYVWSEKLTFHPNYDNASNFNNLFIVYPKNISGIEYLQALEEIEMPLSFFLL